MITKITFWCQKVLPVEFDDSLSYYETLCKVVEKLNEVVDNTNKAFNQLETDVNAELNKKQDTLVSGENIKTVNGQSILGSGNTEIDTGIDVEGNPVGDATDGDLVKIKIGSKIFTIHDYTDIINSKLDKKTNTSTYDQTYVKLASGEQRMINMTPGVISSSLIMRDANGHANIATPEANQHIANKGYVDGAISGKQDKLVSGTNIKTVNGQSILGSGNISIETGGTEVEGNPTGNATDGDLIKIKIGSKIYSIHNYTDAINGKQNTLVSGQNIKTVNGQSILGSGNVSIDTGTDVEGNPTGDPTDGDLIKIKIGSKIYSIHNYTDAINKKQNTLVSGQNIKTVNGQSILGSGNVTIDTGTDVEGNPTADATDGDLSKIKIGSKIYSIHDYTSAINGKLNKDTRTSSYDQVYGKRTTGTQSMINISNSIAVNSLIIRDNNGRAYIAKPTEDNHIANKYYVDDTISGKQDTLVSGTNIKTINGQSILGSGNIAIQGDGNNLHTSTNGTFTGNAGGNGNYTANFYRVGGLATFDVQIYFNPNIGDDFTIVINIPEDYRPSKNIQITSVLNTPTVEHIWNLLSNISDNITTGNMPTNNGWTVRDTTYKIIPQNGAWTLSGFADSDYYSGTISLRCVYVI